MVAVGGAVVVTVTVVVPLGDVVLVVVVVVDILRWCGGCEGLRRGQQEQEGPPARRAGGCEHDASMAGCCMRCEARGARYGDIVL